MKWENKSLDELGEVSRGRSKHRPRNDSVLFGGEYPFVQTADVKKANLYLTEYTTTYNEKGLEQSKLWKAGTLCITIAANIADTAVLGIDACFPDSIMGFVPYEDKANVFFIKYSFDLLQRECKNISQGTAQDNLSWEKLSTIKFRIPSIDSQNKIAEILVTYDNLIENNQKQIKLLEEAAQRLYKEWFVDLRFPGWEDTEIVDGVPEGWNYKNFSEIFEYVRGKSYTSKELSDDKGVIMVNLKNIAPFGGYNRNAEKRFTGTYKDNQVLCSGDIIMGVTDMTQERRLVGQCALVPNFGETAIFSMDLIKIIPIHIAKNFLYAALAYGGYSNIIAPFANGVNVLHLKPESIMKLKMQIPTEELINKYNIFFEKYRERIEVLQNQIQFAKEIRDRLLPKLMSGEIEV